MDDLFTLSVKQPWAHLIIGGYKPIENRTWYTNYRGLVAIHAGAGTRGTRAIYDLPHVRALVASREGLTFGAIVGIADLIDIVHVDDKRMKQKRFAPWVIGPWCWIFERPERIEPIPVKGRLGLYPSPREPILARLGR